jgi:hypothetical protein
MTEGTVNEFVSHFDGMFTRMIEETATKHRSQTSLKSLSDFWQKKRHSNLLGSLKRCFSFLRMEERFMFDVMPPMEIEL